MDLQQSGLSHQKNCLGSRVAWPHPRAAKTGQTKRLPRGAQVGGEAIHSPIPYSLTLPKCIRVHLCRGVHGDIRILMRLPWRVGACYSHSTGYHEGESA